MCLDEAMDICKSSELLQNSQLQESEIGQCYNLAIMTQVDELGKDRVF